MTDWSKAFEVCISGIFGVYLVMGLLLVLTLASTRIIDAIEQRLKRKDEGQNEELKPQTVAVKD